MRSSRLFLIDLPDDAADREQAVSERIAAELLTDPVVETCSMQRQGDLIPEPTDALPVEVHYKPGVMDNVAQSTRVALADMGIAARSVRTARRFELSPPPGESDHPRIRRLLGNDCIEDVFLAARPIEAAPEPPRYEFRLRHVSIRTLDDAALEKLSRQGHLFLSLAEMRAIQEHYRSLRRDPTDLELETLAQTWSEHCVHKTLKSAVVYHGAPMPSLVPGAGEPRDEADGATDDPSATRNPQSALIQNSKSEIQNRPEVEIRYSNLLKDTIARATDELIREGRGPPCLSVFEDNAGVIGFDDEFGVAFKVETHNHPSAIEPYGGAATGVGGVIRDVLGCGLGAKPIANTDVFCVGPPDWPVDGVPRGVIHPKSVLKGVVAGVRDYGNRMGIPTVNGAVHFDPRYLGNPLVFCGCLGLIPRRCVKKAARPGDAIVLLGGRTGRDGIHGATFSSAELSDTHEDEFAHAVQIGNPIEEKKVLDTILLAREYSTGADGARGLFSAITDCGAGGLSSAVGEMAAGLGAEVHLEKVPLKYAGLRYDEIWISESQERMVLAVPPENVPALHDLAAGEDVEATVIGRFTDTGRLLVRYEGKTVGDVDLRFLHDGLPKRELAAEWFAEEMPKRPNAETPKEKVEKSKSRNVESEDGNVEPDWMDALTRRLACPTTASKHWIIHQYDHEVQAGSVVKPLVGRRRGPSDAAVIRPRLGSPRGIAVGCGLAPQLAEADPYWMAVASIDEALRNVVCVGGDPNRTAILDNFCWPRVDHPASLAALVRACQACYDLAKAYGLPFISGKDSLNNEFSLGEGDAAMIDRMLASRGFTGAVRNGRLPIPYTLLISALALVDDVDRTITMDAKQPGATLYLLGQPSHFAQPVAGAASFTSLPAGAGSSSPPLTKGGPGGVKETASEPSYVAAFDVRLAARTHETVARLIRDGLILSAHDVSEGGPLVACAEMCLAAGRGCRVELPASDASAAALAFAESPALYLVEARSDRMDDFHRATDGVATRRFATVLSESDSGVELVFNNGDAPVSIDGETLYGAWRRPLDW